MIVLQGNLKRAEKQWQKEVQALEFKLLGAQSDMRRQQASLGDEIHSLKQKLAAAEGKLSSETQRADFATHLKAETDAKAAELALKLSEARSEAQMGQEAATRARQDGEAKIAVLIQQV